MRFEGVKLHPPALSNKSLAEETYISQTEDDDDKDDVEEEKRVCPATYRHFRARVVDENHFRLFAVQQNADRLLSKLVI